MRKRWISHLVVLFLYTALTLAMTWPVAAQLRTHVAGEGGDVWQTMWRFGHNWSLVEKVWNSPEPRRVQGAMQFLHSEFLGGGAPRLVNLSVWPWMGMHIAFDQPVAYNLAWLLSFILSGYSMFLLVRYLVGKRDEFPIPNSQFPIFDLAAFIAGVYYMFLPFHTAHAQGHFGAMQTQWLPLLVLGWLAWWKQPKTWKAICFALLLLMQVWTEHHYALWFSLFILVWTAFHWRLVRQRALQFPSLRPAVAKAMAGRQGYGRQAIPNSQFPKLFLAMAAVILLLTVLVLSISPTIRLAGMDDSSLDLGQEQLIRFSADLFAFVVPSPFHPLWGNVMRGLFTASFTGNEAEAIQYVGLVPWLLILFFWRQIPVQLRRFWGFTAVGFFVISLGPRLHVFGNVLGIPLPYDLIDDLPVLSSVRAVARAGAMVGLGMAVLLGAVVARQFKRLGSVAVLLVIILFDWLFLPVSVQSTELSGVYEAVRSVEGRQIIEVPAATNYTAASKSLFASRIHGKEVFGNIALERAQDPKVLALSRSVPAVRQILFARTTDLRERRPDFFDQDLLETLPDALRWLEVGAIIVHSDSLSAFQTATLNRFLTDAGLKPQDFGEAVLYRVPDVFTAASDGVFLMRDSGFEHVGYDEKRDSVLAEVSDTAVLTIVNTLPEKQRVVLQFAGAKESIGTATISQAGNVLYTLRPGAGPVSIELAVPPGAQDVIFKTVGSDKVIIEDPKFEVPVTSN